MKGEYMEEEENNNNNNNNNNNKNNNTSSHNMFAKFSQHPNFQPQPQHFPPPHLHSNHPPFPEESPSTTATPSQPPPSSKKPKPTTSNEEGGSGTIELSRRPRGRPPGSKNKPKPPIVITREPEPAMSPYILELQTGSDIIDSLTRFTRRRGVGLCVLTASGSVANVTLKQPSTTTPGGTVTFHGRFDILSLSAVVVNTAAFCGGGGGFTISLAGPQGQIVGGKVVGSLVCSGTVYVIATSFNNPTYCRLPLDEQDNNNNNNNNNSSQIQQLPHGNNNQCDNQENSPVSGGGDGGGVGGSMSLYSGPLGTATTSTTAGEVIWATPTSARPY